MIFDPKILDYIDTDFINGISEIKDGTPKRIVEDINGINELYKQIYGKYLWTFKKEV